MATILGKVLCGYKFIIDTGDLVYELDKLLGFRGYFGLQILRLTEKLMLRLASGIVVRGTFHKQFLETRGYKRIFYIPDGVDTSLFMPYDVFDLRNQLRLTDKLVVGTIGATTWSEKYKMCYGWDLIEVINLLKNLPVIGIFIGDGSGLPYLKQKAREYNIEDKILFLGRIPYEEVPKYLNVFDICLLTQSNHPISMVRTTRKLPCFLACGKYILASEVGEASLILPKEMLIPYKGVKDIDYPYRLMEMIEKIYKDRSILKKGELGVKIAKDRFEYTILAKRVSEIVLKCVSSKTLIGLVSGKNIQKIRVLVVSHSCIVDVNQAPFVELSTYLGIELALVTPRYFKDITFPFQLKFQKHPNLNAKVYPLRSFLSNLPDKNINLHFYPDWLKVMHQFKPDIIHIDEEPYSVSTFQFALAKGKANLLFFAAQNIFKQYLPPFNEFEKYVYRKSSCAIAASEMAKSVLVRKGYHKRIFVIPYSIDFDRFYKKDSQLLKSKLNLTGFVIGYVGRLTKWKGVDTLIKAVKKLTNISAPISLLIVGGGPVEHKVRELVTNLNMQKITRIIGGVLHSEVPNYLNCMNVLVLPSTTIGYWREQFGRVLIEAMACEVPVVGSDSGEIPNIIKKTGGGLIFAEGDVDDLAQKLTLLIQSPELADKLAKEGSEMAFKNYSSKLNAERFYSVYKYIFNKR
ncbi:MAG: glycosyltransferase [bacterium]|nr:glycosyltransferase [bacterium]